MTEEWRPVTNFAGYAVSSEGQVMRTAAQRGARAGRILKQRINRDGYCCVTLHNKPERKSFLVNRLVCEAFHGLPPSVEHQAAHNDGLSQNNCAGNLRWATKDENEADKERHGTRMRGDGHANSKLTEALVHEIRADSRTTYEIAATHGVSQSLVSLVRTRKVWAHV